MAESDWEWARAVIEMDAEPDSIGIAARAVLRRLDTLAARLAEFQRLYRGQIANDGSYPDHLFASDSASACTCDGEYKYDGDCPIHGDPSFASDQPTERVK